jgi:hypothetical protein
MKNGSKSIISRVFTLMMAVAMGCVILAGKDYGTEITRTAYSYASAQDGFDPNALPAPAAGMRDGNKTTAYDCKDMIYQTSKNGINYVREYGGVYNAAIVNNRFGLYKLDYGHLQMEDSTAVLDPYSIRKLRHALQNCNETYIRSGAHILTSTSTTLSG